MKFYPTRGNRKMFGFYLLLGSYLLILLIGLIAVISSDALTLTDWAMMPVPVATGLMLIGAPFFIGNAVSKIGTKIEFKAENEIDN